MHYFSNMFPGHPGKPVFSRGKCFCVLESSPVFKCKQTVLPFFHVNWTSKAVSTVMQIRPLSVNPLT